MRHGVLIMIAGLVSFACGGNVVVDASASTMSSGAGGAGPCPGFTQYCDQGECFGAALCSSNVCTDPTQAQSLACFAALPLDAGCDALNVCGAK